MTQAKLSQVRAQQRSRLCPTKKATLLRMIKIASRQTLTRAFVVMTASLGKKSKSHLNCLEHSMVLHMCFERFLLAFESRDLSQADKRITRVSSFPSFNFWMINYSYTQKSYLALWQNCFGKFITKKFPSLKSKQFYQFFLVRGKSERIDKI